MLRSAILIALHGIATKDTPLKQRPEASCPENENQGPSLRPRGVLLVALFLASVGTLALGNYLFSSAPQTASAFRVLDGGVITGKSIQVNSEGLPEYFIRYRRPNQSQATWQVPAQVYRERQSGQSMYFFQPTLRSGGLIVLFFLSVLACIILSTAAFSPFWSTVESPPEKDEKQGIHPQKPLQAKVWLSPRFTAASQLPGNIPGPVPQYVGCRQSIVAPPGL